MGEGEGDGISKVSGSCQIVVRMCPIVTGSYQMMSGRRWMVFKMCQIVLEKCLIVSGRCWMVSRRCQMVSGSAQSIF